VGARGHHHTFPRLLRAYLLRVGMTLETTLPPISTTSMTPYSLYQQPL